MYILHTSPTKQTLQLLGFESLGRWILLSLFFILSNLNYVVYFYIPNFHINSLSSLSSKLQNKEKSFLRHIFIVLSNVCPISILQNCFFVRNLFNFLKEWISQKSIDSPNTLICLWCHFPFKLLDAYATKH